MKITVAYPHEPANLDGVYLAVIPAGRAPSASEWKPAFRDMLHGKRVVWARFDPPATPPPTPNVVWLRDRASDRLVQPLV